MKILKEILTYLLAALIALGIVGILFWIVRKIIEVVFMFILALIVFSLMCMV